MKRLISFILILLILFTYPYNNVYSQTCSLYGCRIVGPLKVDGQTTINDQSGNIYLGANNLNHWRSVVSKVRAGTARGKVFVLGDSTSTGSGAGTGGVGQTNNAFTKSWPIIMSGLMNNTLPVSNKSFFNNAGAPGANYTAYDGRVTLGTGWSNPSSPGSLGGAMFQFQTGAPGTLSFTPVGTIDTITVWYLQQSGNGTATINTDGGPSLGTINFNSTSLVTSSTFTVPKGPHTINIVANNDATIWVLGVISYDSTVSAIDFINASQYGSVIGNYSSNTNAYDPAVVLAKVAPDLTIIDLTVNDSNLKTGVSAYTTNMQTIITQALKSGDVLLIAGPPSNTTQATDGTLANYVSTLKTLADTNQLSMVDIGQRWTSYAVANSVTPYFDSLHPTVVGYTDMAVAIGNALLGSVSAPSGTLSATPLSNQPANSTTTVTLPVASPGIVNWTAHGLQALSPVYFTTSGALPTGLTQFVTVYITQGSVTTNSFQVSDTLAHALSGISINFTGSPSGTQTSHVGIAASNGAAVDIEGLPLAAGNYLCQGTVTPSYSGGTSVTAEALWLSTSGASALPATITQILATGLTGYSTAAIVQPANTNTTGVIPITLAANGMIVLASQWSFTVSAPTLFGGLICWPQKS